MKHVREAAGRHRAATRPRYGRISVLAAAFVVTAVAVAGGFGFLPTGADRSAAASSLTNSTDQGSEDAAPEQQEPTQRPRRSGGTALADTGSRIAASSGSTALPEASGSGKRIVFSETQQRVWLVAEGEEVARTYPVSGSIYENLEPGSYAVYSRSRHAVGIDDSGTMEYFVRFTHGTQGAAIGFHTIPVDDGRPVQTVGQLGTPLSHGCIRQERSNAIALWDFAPVGTKVVVTD